jgi:3,2-trans-enoyl-CoA isomerase
VIFDVVVLLFRFIDSMRNVIGHRESERALQLGTMFTPAEALKIGLVDNVVNETETVETARLELLKWLKVPG